MMRASPLLEQLQLPALKSLSQQKRSLPQAMRLPSVSSGSRHALPHMLLFHCGLVQAPRCTAPRVMLGKASLSVVAMHKALLKHVQPPGQQEEMGVESISQGKYPRARSPPG